jgi:hypothetical protein
MSEEFLGYTAVLAAFTTLFMSVKLFDFSFGSTNEMVQKIAKLPLVLVVLWELTTWGLAVEMLSSYPYPISSLNVTQAKVNGRVGFSVFTFTICFVTMAFTMIGRMYNVSREKFNPHPGYSQSTIDRINPLTSGDASASLVLTGGKGDYAWFLYPVLPYMLWYPVIVFTQIYDGWSVYEGKPSYIRYDWQWINLFTVCFIIFAFVGYLILLTGNKNSLTGVQRSTKVFPNGETLATVHHWFINPAWIASLVLLEMSAILEYYNDPHRFVTWVVVTVLVPLMFTMSTGTFSTFMDFNLQAKVCYFTCIFFPWLSRLGRDDIGMEDGLLAPSGQYTWFWYPWNWATGVQYGGADSTDFLRYLMSIAALLLFVAGCIMIFMDKVFLKKATVQVEKKLDDIKEGVENGIAEITGSRRSIASTASFNSRG